MRRPDKKRFDLPTALLFAVPILIMALLTARTVRIGMTRRALMDAAANGDIARLKQLLEAGADINSKDERGWTPLFHAASERRLDAVRFLLDSGADVNARDSGHTTALVAAANNPMSSIGNPLASSPVNTRVILLLLDHGADARVKTEDGWTPLIFTAMSGDTASVNALLARGADVNARNDDGVTALLFAAGNMHVETVKALLDHGADPNVRERSTGNTPLLNAIGSPAGVKIVQMLLAHGAKTDVKDNIGITPLKLAYKRGLQATVALLKHAGATK